VHALGLWPLPALQQRPHFFKQNLAHGPQSGFEGLELKSLKLEMWFGGNEGVNGAFLQAKIGSLSYCFDCDCWISLYIHLVAHIRVREIKLGREKREGWRQLEVWVRRRVRDTGY